MIKVCQPLLSSRLKLYSFVQLLRHVANEAIDHNLGGKKIGTAIKRAVYGKLSQTLLANWLASHLLVFTPHLC